MVVSKLLAPCFILGDARTGENNNTRSLPEFETSLVNQKHQPKKRNWKNNQEPLSRERNVSTEEIRGEIFTMNTSCSLKVSTGIYFDTEE